MNLPEDVQEAIAPVLGVLPLEEAMPELVPSGPAAPEVCAAVAAAAAHPAIESRPPLAAGLWLYADELDRSHVISQGIADRTGSYWHGIMHRREGDFGNSQYWFGRVGRHPAMELLRDYDARVLVDECARRHDDNPADLVALQRREWANLFAWCART